MDEYDNLREWVANCIQTIVERGEEYKILVKQLNYKQTLDHVKMMHVDEEHRRIIKRILIWLRGDKNDSPFPFMKHTKQDSKNRALLHDVAEKLGLGHITIEVDTERVFCGIHEKWCNSYYDDPYSNGRVYDDDYRCTDYDYRSKCYPERKKIHDIITYITFPCIKNKEQLDECLMNHGINPYIFEYDAFVPKYLTF